MKNQLPFVVVIGASAGGLNALAELVTQLDEDINAAFLIVLHLSRRGISDFLVHRLQKNTSLQCRLAVNGADIKKAHIYVAPPNFHLLVKDDKLIIGHGPEENRWRPSIDVLFRSAAVAYKGRSIGIILTGLLDDGTAGMLAIKDCGGTCIVQDPNEAEYPDMPLAVLNVMEADYCVLLAEMGAVITETIQNKELDEEFVIPPALIAESEISQRVAIGIENVEALGEGSVYSCPDCGGHLWHIDENNMSRYRCHVGHAYSEKDLIVKMSENLESTLWVALRIMDERKNLLKKLEEDSRQRGFVRISAGHREKKEDIEVHIENLKGILFDTQNISSL